MLKPVASGLLLLSMIMLLTANFLPAQNKPGKKPPTTPVPKVNPGDQPNDPARDPRVANPKDARNKVADKEKPFHDPAYAEYALFEKTSPKPPKTNAIITKLPLELKPNDRICFIGNSLLEREQYYGDLETLITQKFPQHQLSFRNFTWSGDTPDLMPRTDNFADVHQHLFYVKADVIFAAFGFNESFAGKTGLESFKSSLTKFVQQLKTHAYNGSSGPRIVLFGPIANENIANIPAGTNNNENLQAYSSLMQELAKQEQIGFINNFDDLLKSQQNNQTQLTINGVHLNQHGHEIFARTAFKQLFNEDASTINPVLKEAIVDKNKQFFRRYRPLNTYYYTGGRNKDYGYLDFLPAMKNFELMVKNREARISQIAKGETFAEKIDDSKLPELPPAIQSRGVNEWLTAEKEQAAFKVDPKFAVNLFAGEEQFPELADPIQIRWDSKGRMWVSCSTTYPHVYPGQEPHDKILILEDLDGDGKADTCKTFADDLHVPLSFEFWNNGILVSEQPHLTFLKDTNGDDRADIHEIVLTGFGTEDSHHALHDFSWTPDGDLIFRESIFHHSQVETPYGPVRQQNSGWFRFDPKRCRLTSIGSYPSTNPWGVTFDDWGNHMASHPVFAEAFHALDPPYPQQHPAPKGLRAYSGTCGHAFVDNSSFPEDMQGWFIKARYKPTNRIEIHQWKESEFGYDEEYVSDLIFSTNLSFIPVDLNFGPRGDLFICDWYNPVKGHAQYSLRDERRDRHSGRIWRVTTKGKPSLPNPRIDQMSVTELIDLLKSPTYRLRYMAKLELRNRDHQEVMTALQNFSKSLNSRDPRYRHHQVEVMWTYRWLDEVNTDLMQELIKSEEPHARAAAVKQLRYWFQHTENLYPLLQRAVNDPVGIVRMEAAITASWMGTKEAFDILLDILKQPHEGHLTYAIVCSFGSKTMQPFWKGNNKYPIEKLIKQASTNDTLKEPKPTAEQAKFDQQPDLLTVKISCVPERMLFSVTQISAKLGQPVKIVFINPDATDHNLVLVKQGALAEVGMAANEMARDPANASSDFIPQSKQELILAASPMIGPTRKSQVHVMRFTAPKDKGLYPYVCTFPGHWIIMNGTLVVAESSQEAELLLTAAKPKIIQHWKIEDFKDLQISKEEKVIMDGMQSFVKANCNQCHQMSGHGVNLGPDLNKSKKEYQGIKLLTQILSPSEIIHKDYQTWQILSDDGKQTVGIISKEDDKTVTIIPNLLLPQNTVAITKESIVDRKQSKVSQMPAGLLDVLTREEILALMAYLQSDGYVLPEHLQKMHHHGSDK